MTTFHSLIPSGFSGFVAGTDQALGVDEAGLCLEALGAEVKEAVDEEPVPEQTPPAAIMACTRAQPPALRRAVVARQPRAVIDTGPEVALAALWRGPIQVVQEEIGRGDSRVEIEFTDHHTRGVDFYGVVLLEWQGNKARVVGIRVIDLATIEPGQKEFQTATYDVNDGWLRLSETSAVHYHFRVAGNQVFVERFLGKTLSEISFEAEKTGLSPEETREPKASNVLPRGVALVPVVATKGGDRRVLLEQKVSAALVTTISNPAGDYVIKAGYSLKDVREAISLVVTVLPHVARISELSMLLREDLHFFPSHLAGQVDVARTAKDLYYDRRFGSVKVHQLLFWATWAKHRIQRNALSDESFQMWRTIVLKRRRGERRQPGYYGRMQTVALSIPDESMGVHDRERSAAQLMRELFVKKGIPLTLVQGFIRARPDFDLKTAKAKFKKIAHEAKSQKIPLVLLTPEHVVAVYDGALARDVVASIQQPAVEATAVVSVQVPETRLQKITRELAERLPAGAQRNEDQILQAIDLFDLEETSEYFTQAVFYLIHIDVLARFIGQPGSLQAIVLYCTSEGFEEEDVVQVMEALASQAEVYPRALEHALMMDYLPAYKWLVHLEGADRWQGLFATAGMQEGAVENGLEDLLAFIAPRFLGMGPRPKGIIRQALDAYIASEATEEQTSQILERYSYQ